MPKFILLMVFFFSSCYSEISILPPGDEHYRAENSLITFTCQMTGNSPDVDAKLKWFDRQNKEIINDKFQDPRIYTERENRQIYRLIIQKILRQDQGSYRCQGYDNGEFVNRYVTLKVFRGITFEYAPPLQNPKIHTDAIIECRVTGNPNPEVTWRYRGKVLPHGGRYTYDTVGLIIRDVTRDDDGEYFCRAEISRLGVSDQRVITVIVHTPPTGTLAPGQVRGRERDDFALECRAASVPPPRYSFHRGDPRSSPPLGGSHRVHLDSAGGTLTFRPLHRDDDGRYVCRAYNDVGEWLSEGNLTVIVRPRVYHINTERGREGGRLQFFCSVDAIPPARILFWKRDSPHPYDAGHNENGRIVIDYERANRLRMTVDPLTPDDHHNYTCVAENEGGRDWRDGQLWVDYRPRFSNSSYSMRYWLWEGKTRNLTCELDGEPFPRAEWYHRRDRIYQQNETYRLFENDWRVGRRSVLQVYAYFVNVGWVFGDYECRAVNPLGYRSLRLPLLQATAPGVPAALRVISAYPTRLQFHITAPLSDGGQPLLGYRIDYNGLSTHFVLGEPVVLYDLLPARRVSLQVRARNEVGVSQPLDFGGDTPPARRPFPLHISSAQYGRQAFSYTLRWLRPLTGGHRIEWYEFRLRRVHAPGYHIPPSNNSSVAQYDTDIHPIGSWQRYRVLDNEREPLRYHVFRMLRPGSYYQVEARARNELGLSDVHEPFVFNTTDSAWFYMMFGRSSASYLSHHCSLVMYFITVILTLRTLTRNS